MKCTFDVLQFALLLPIISHYIIVIFILNICILQGHVYNLRLFLHMSADYFANNVMSLYYYSISINHQPSIWFYNRRKSDTVVNDIGMEIKKREQINITLVGIFEKSNKWFGL